MSNELDDLKETLTRLELLQNRIHILEGRAAESKVNRLHTLIMVVCLVLVAVTSISTIIFLAVSLSGIQNRLVELYSLLASV